MSDEVVAGDAEGVKIEDLDVIVAGDELRRQTVQDHLAVAMTMIGLAMAVVCGFVFLNLRILDSYGLIRWPSLWLLGSLWGLGIAGVLVFSGASLTFLRAGTLNPFRRAIGSAESLLTAPPIAISESPAEERMSESRTVYTPEEIHFRRVNSDVGRLERAIYTRLKAEIVDQGRKASSNLTFGTAGALIAFAVLAGTIMFPAHETKSTFYAWSGFVARVMLSVTSSVFAFFFLSTYRRNLSEIRYFHNELTNVEMRTLAIRRYMTGLVKKSESSDDLVAEMLMSLMNTERNFILRKGESTTDLSQKELDRDELIAWVSGIATAMAVPDPTKPPTESSNSKRKTKGK